MTFLEVLDDAVKIGLGGLTGWLIAKGTRSHEFEKERRRRKQDCLERVVEDLDEQQSAFGDWCVNCLTYRKITEQKEKNPAMEQQSLKLVNHSNENSELARTKLIRSHSKLIVFGFHECAAALLAYNSKLLTFRVVVTAVRQSQKEMAEYSSGRDELRKCVDNIRATVTKAFEIL